MNLSDLLRPRPARVPLPGGPAPSGGRAVRERRRRGGPRTPLPLLPVIAICAGVGLAYVNQTAKATQDTYHETSLISQQQQLSNEDQQLGAELARLEAAPQIIAEAQRLGMVPTGTWTYAGASPRPLVSPAASELAAPPPPRAAAAGLSGALSAVVGGGG